MAKTCTELKASSASSPAGRPHGRPRALGVAFMGLAEAQGVGFIIPAKVAMRFLEDFRLNGTFTHFGYPPFLWQCLETEEFVGPGSELDSLSHAHPK